LKNFSSFLDLSDQVYRNNTGTTRHCRDEAKGGGTILDSELDLINAADATDVDACLFGRLHKTFAL
jgi:hypothetical protein